jgi:gamma-glutamyltranspeptidase
MLYSPSGWRVRLLATTAFFAAAAFSTPTLSADAEAEVEEIVVVAQRPRIYQVGVDGPLQLEEAIPQDLVAGLQGKGHRVERSQILGSTQSIMIGPDGVMYGAADTRRPDAGVAAVRQY